MEMSKSLDLVLIVLLPAVFLYPSASATSLSISGIFLGEPDVFVPGVGLSAELPITRSIGMSAGMAFFLSGSWDLIAGVI